MINNVQCEGRFAFSLHLLPPAFHTFYSLTVLSTTPWVLPLFSWFFPGSPLLITIIFQPEKDFIYQDIMYYFFEFGDIWPAHRMTACDSKIGSLSKERSTLEYVLLAIYFDNWHLRTLHCDLFLDDISHLACSAASLPSFSLPTLCPNLYLGSLCLSYSLLFFFFFLFIFLLSTFNALSPSNIYFIFAHAYFCHQLKCYLCHENFPQLFPLKYFLV